MLIPFEIIPTPTTEMQIIKKIMLDFETRKLRIKEQLFILSKSWWEAWTSYVHYAADEESISSRLSKAIKRIPSYRMEEKPVNIDNSDI